MYSISQALKKAGQFNCLQIEKSTTNLAFILVFLIHWVPFHKSRILDLLQDIHILECHIVQVIF